MDRIPEDKEQHGVQPVLFLPNCVRNGIRPTISPKLPNTDKVQPPSKTILNSDLAVDNTLLLVWPLLSLRELSHVCCFDARNTYEIPMSPVSENSEPELSNCITWTADSKKSKRRHTSTIARKTKKFSTGIPFILSLATSLHALEWFHEVIVDVTELREFRSIIGPKFPIKWIIETKTPKRGSVS